MFLATVHENKPNDQTAHFHWLNLVTDIIILALNRDLFNANAQAQTKN